jgi:hypothetical protein
LEHVTAIDGMQLFDPCMSRSIPVNAAAQRCTFAILLSFSLNHTDQLIVIDLSMHSLAASARAAGIFAKRGIFLSLHGISSSGSTVLVTNY